MLQILDFEEGKVDAPIEHLAMAAAIILAAREKEKCRNLSS